MTIVKTSHRSSNPHVREWENICSLFAVELGGKCEDFISFE